ncbi:T9SS type B sorting domain-containing protein [Flavobacterium album]|nr:T9SS type B sorting domain-containing protein [Flavobacterium album]
MSTQVAADGNVYIAGTGRSTNGISTPGAYKEVTDGDGFIAKFDSSGARIWGTYIGGENYDAIFRGKLAGNNFCVQGITTSLTNIGTPNAFNSSYQQSSDLSNYFIINFDVSTQQVIWGTYFTSQITDLFVTPNNEVYFCGDTHATTGISTPDSYMPVKGPYIKSFLIKLNNIGQRIWGTYYGGNMGEQICFLAVDTLGDIYMHGMCNQSTTGIATENAFQSSIPPGTMSTYIVKFRDCASASTVSSNSPLCIGQNIELHAQGGTNYLWTGPNGFTSTEQNPVIPMAAAVNNGTYSCFISGTGCDATVTTDIVVGDTLAPVPSLPALPAISGECSVTVAIIPTAIDNCSGTINAVTADPLQYNTIGTYTLHWNYTDNNGNTATQQQTVTVNPASGPVINTEVSFSQCEGSTTIFDLPSVNPQITTYPGAVFTFYLSNSDALSQTGAINNPQSFSTTSSRDVYALVVLPNGCKAVATIHLIINAKPVLNNAVLAKCFGAGTAEFDLTEAQNIIDPSGILTLSYYASQNDLTTNNAIANSTNFGIAGTVQTIYVKGVNSNGCANTAELQVTASNISEMLLPDHLECADPDGNEIAFDLSEYQDEILTLLPTDTYAFEYYGSYDDAYNGTSNSLPAEYTFSSGSREIFFRVMGTTGCPYIIKLNLNIIDRPVLSMNAEYTFCRGSDITITAGSTYDSYEWSTGSLRPEIVVSQPGDYSLMVGKVTGGVTCYTTKHFTVTASDEPHIEDVIIQDLTDSDNMITVYPDEDTYEYSVDGITYQQSNIFTGLQSGMYTVYVRDTARCGIDSRKVTLLMYPKYFSPNADGKNDYWHIKNSFFSEKMTVFIYDRYGKVLASFNQHTQGWDGTYNGRPMPATDYWFVIERENGTEFKGHFSLLR